MGIKERPIESETLFSEIRLDSTESIIVYCNVTQARIVNETAAMETVGGNGRTSCDPTKQDVIARGSVSAEIFISA